MKTNFQNSHATKLLSNTQSARTITFELICYVFILLFTYTGWEKLQNFISFSKAFQHALLPGLASRIAATGILLAEFSVAALLVRPKSRKTGLVLSLTMMLIFSSYLVILQLSGSTMPCQCGGLLDSLSWTNHILLNLALAGLAALALLIHYSPDTKTLRA